MILQIILLITLVANDAVWIQTFSLLDQFKNANLTVPDALILFILFVTLVIVHKKFNFTRVAVKRRVTILILFLIVFKKTRIKSSIFKLLRE